ncbi:hypothetical protein CYMTET_27830 [Cymbomonas tetramitiformis]|uniref:Tyrosine-protein kinase ephrin type A/B receptor-like domain-containing protein n=1 Tax=Cymbomonas tetramitiformis TaxID=36881 RepID=A0AAE0KWT5_9CHLO|nr:hypothetical protein CYMTET_27830 [Cymbomonas tetramitiformis]
MHRSSDGHMKLCVWVCVMQATKRFFEEVEAVFDPEEGRYEGAVREVSPLGRYEVFVRCVVDATTQADPENYPGAGWGGAGHLQGSPLTYIFHAVECDARMHLESNAAGDACVCSAGHAASANGTCVACPAGSYRTLQDLGCRSCPQDRTTAAPGATADTACVCAPGYRAAMGGSANSTEACEECPAGTYQDIPGATTCTHCPLGTAQPSTAATMAAQCTLCGVGLVAAEAGSPTCAPCADVEAITVAGIYGECFCRDGFFSDPEGPSGAAKECLECDPSVRLLPCQNCHLRLATRVDVVHCDPTRRFLPGGSWAPSQARHSSTGPHP